MTLVFAVLMDKVKIYYFSEIQSMETVHKLIIALSLLQPDKSIDEEGTMIRLEDNNKKMYICTYIASTILKIIFSLTLWILRLLLAVRRRVVPLIINTVGPLLRV